MKSQMANKSKSVEEQKEVLKEPQGQILPEKRDVKKAVNNGYDPPLKMETSRYFRAPDEPLFDVEAKTITRKSEISKEDSTYGKSEIVDFPSFEDYSKYLTPEQKKNRLPTAEEIQEAAERFLRVKQLMKEQEEINSKRRAAQAKLDSMIYTEKPSSALSYYDNIKKMSRKKD